MRRKLLIGSAVVAAIVAIPVAVMAFTTSSRLDHQTAKMTGRAVMTSSKQWRDIKGLHYLRVCAQGQVTAMVSVSVSGGPVRFRVQVDDDGNFFPQKAEFAPGGGSPKGFSFTFIGSVGTFEGVDEHVFDVQWRSVTGAPVTARARLLNLLYKRGAHC